MPRAHACPAFVSITNSSPFSQSYNYFHLPLNIRTTCDAPANPSYPLESLASTYLSPPNFVPSHTALVCCARACVCPASDNARHGPTRARLVRQAADKVHFGKRACGECASAAGYVEEGCFPHRGDVEGAFCDLLLSSLSLMEGITVVIL